MARSEGTIELRKSYLMKRLMLIASLFPFIFQAQLLPCIDGFAGEYPCDGYDLVAHLSLAQLGSTANGNDSWGWTDPITGADYALMGMANGTAFVELCDAENPVILGLLPSHSGSSLWRDVKVYQDHAFIVSEAGGHGMQVFDLNQLRDVTAPPVIFTETAHYGAFGSSHNIAINEASGYAYPVGTSLYDGGPVFINIQDPENPIAAGGYDGDGYTHDAQIVIYEGPDADWNGKEICFACNADTFTIIDVNNKMDPQEISRTGYDQVGYTHQGWLSEDHQFFFLGDEGDENGGIGNTRTIVWDVSDLDNPLVVEYHQGTNGAIDHNMYTYNGKVYQANYTSGLRVLQINETGNPYLTEVGFFDVYPAGDPSSFSGAWSCFPYYESGLVIISSMDRGLFVVKPSDLVLAECSPPSALNENQLEIGLRILPNPVQDELFLTWDEPIKGQLLIMDAQGKILVKENLNAHTNAVKDLSKWSSGLYILSIISDQGTISKRIIKQ